MSLGLIENDKSALVNQLDESRRCQKDNCVPRTQKTEKSRHAFVVDSKQLLDVGFGKQGIGG